MIWTLDVGWTTRRPVVPDERVSRVTVVAGSAYEAWLMACAVVGCHAEMVTSTTILDWP